MAVQILYLFIQQTDKLIDSYINLNILVSVYYGGDNYGIQTKGFS